jgi:N-acetyl-anhydromuramyl-L-alanine amidase AmpD
MAYTFIQGNQAHTSGPNGEITRVVIHATVSACVPGGARGNAQYFQSAGAGGLAHFVVDPGEVVQCCAEDVACWHAPPNHGSIGVELCDPQDGGNHWGDNNHKAMLHLAARLVRDLCIRHNIPMQYIGKNDLLMGKKGITTHYDVSQAWHQSDHHDPGPAFPMHDFIALVNQGSTPEGYVATLDPQDKHDIISGLYNLLHQDFVIMLRGDQNHPNSITSIKETVDKIAAKEGL